MIREDIVKNILLKIDEISPFDEPDEQLDGLIDGMLDDCAKNYLRIIPLHLIRDNISNAQGSQTNSPIIGRLPNNGLRHDNGLGKWTVTNSDKYLRLIKVSCRFWRRPVVDVIPTEDVTYNQEFDRFTCSGVCRPKVYIESEGGNRTLILAPFRKGPQWDESSFTCEYVKECNAEDLPDEILDPFYYYAAANILTSMQRSDFAAKCMEIMQQLIIKRQ